MTLPSRLAACCTLLAAALLPCAAQGAASVTYLNPEKMTDVPRFLRDRESMEAELQAHFDMLSEKLPPGQRLIVDVLDIDLAGEVFPRVSIHDVRVLKGRADWPHMHLRYRIEQDGKVVSSGERRLSDMNYLMGSNRYTSENFPHEKKMLDDWFRKEIIAAR